MCRRHISVQILFPLRLTLWSVTRTSFQAWLLWKREKWCELIDPCLDVKHPNMEIMRFINVGLMCVQDGAVDRPTISDAISLLMNESTILPDPKKPAYFRNKGEDPELGTIQCKPPYWFTYGW